MDSKRTFFIRNQNIVYTLLAISASVVNFVTLIIFGRIFIVDDYGTITTFQALIANIGVCMTPIQIFLCKTIAEGSQGKTSTINSIISLVVILNVLVIFILLVFSFSLLTYLHFASLLDYAVFLLLVISNNLYLVLTGFVQGKQDFLLLGILGLVLYVIKLVVGVCLGLLGIGPLAVIIGFCLADLLCIIIIWKRNLVSLVPVLTHFRICLDVSTVKKIIVATVLYIFVSFYMNNGDLIIGNMFSSNYEIGLYSVAINLAKISVFLIAVPVGTLLLPRIAASNGDKKRQIKYLLFAEGVTFIVSLIYGLCFLLLNSMAITMLYGADYSGASQYVFWCIIFSIILGLFWVFYQYAFATKLLNYFAVTTFMIGLLEVVIMLFYRTEISVIPELLSFGMVLSIAVSVLAYFLIKRISYEE